MRLRYNVCLLLFLSATIVTGCSKKNESTPYNHYQEEGAVDGYSIDAEYNFKNAAKDGFVIYQEDTIINEEKIEEFYNKTRNDQDCTLNILRYTSSNDPIVLQYIYKDNKYTVYIDNTRDKTLQGKIIVRTIKDIEINTDSNGYKIIVEKY